jgi:hypothetical protein
MRIHRYAVSLALLSGLVFRSALPAQPGTIVTVAGNGWTGGASGVGGPSVNAFLAGPGGIAIDSANNFYIADNSSNRVLRVDAVTGILTLVAGNGTAASSGDGGPAALASVNRPYSLALDAARNLFIAEAGGNRIRRVDAATGIITTVAGTGTAAFSGDGGPAVGASLRQPLGVALDSAGNLFIADSGNVRIRRVDAQSGIITTAAGNGSSGVTADGALATAASLSGPLPGVSVDPAGNLLISESGSTSIRRVDAVTGILGTFAGNGVAGFSGDGVAATSAGIGKMPTNVAFDSAGNAFFADGSGRIRRVDGATGIITTVAGNGTGLQDSLSIGGDGGGGPYYIPVVGDNGPATSATLDGPLSVAVTSNGNLIFTDWIDCRARGVYLPSPLPYTNTTVTASPASVVQGQPVTFTATVTPMGASGVPNGAIRFAEISMGGSTVLGTATMTNGGATLSIAAPQATGVYQILAYYSGDGVFNGSGSPLLPLTVTSHPTPIVTTTSSQNPAPQNTPVTITVTAAAPAGSTAQPTGTVVLEDNYTAIGNATLVNGSAQFTVSFATPGSHPLYANYSGDANYNHILAPVFNQMVNAAATVTLTSNPNPSGVGAYVGFTATVLPASATGTVQFLDGSTVLGTATLAYGTAFLSTPNLTLGAHSVQAVYSGDGSNGGATSSFLTQTVLLATSVVVSSSPQISTVGQSVSFTASVSPASATGMVFFKEGGILLGVASIAGGNAVMAISTLSAGTHVIAGFYQGDSTYAPGVTAFPLSQLVLAVATTTLTTSATPSTYGQSITFTVSVSPASATGQILLRDGSTLVGGGTLAGGAYVQAISTLGGGSHSITASYSGDAAYAPSTSPAVAQIIAQATPTFTLTSSLNPSLSGQSVTYTANFTPISTIGALAILDSQPPPSSTGQWGIPGQFKMTSSTLAPGTHSVTAVWSGDANVAAGTSAALIQTVQAATTLSVAAGSGPFVYGQPVTFTAALSPIGATGAINFTDGGNALGTAPISLGTATLTVPSLPAGNHQIAGTYSGDGVFLPSNTTLTVSIAKATATAALASSLNPSVAGQAVTLTAVVSPGSVTGSVQFLDGATVLGTAPLSGGIAAFSTSALAGGIHSITSVYSGDPNYAASTSSALSQTVKVTSSIIVGFDVSPVVYGQQVTLMSSVTPSAATGTVQFTDGATVLATVPVSGGTANFPISTLSTGTHTIVAAYSGDAMNGSSTSPPAILNVGKASATVAVASSLNPAVSGQSVTFTAAVTPSAASGTVQFKDGATVLGSATMSGGAAVLSTSSLGAGSHSITASYSGDGNYNSASTALTQTVKATTATTLSASNGSIALGQTVQLTASVVPAAATGTVQFMDGAGVLGTVTLSGGAAVLAVSNLAVGSHTLTAAYSGDGNDTASSSTAVVVTVSKTNSSVTVTSSLNPATSGQSVTFTAAVTPSAATGTVQFKDGATVLGSATVSGGVAVLSTSSLGAGSHSITASYSGDGNYNGASTALTQTVKATTATTLSANKASIAFGQTVQLTASVVPLTATGTVQFMDGAGVLGTVTLSGGAAALAVSNLAVGSHTLTAVYSGDGNDAASSSTVVAVTVSKANSSVTATSSLNPAVSGQAVTFTAAVTPSAATGTVQFKDGAAVLGSAAVSGGAAAFAISTLSVGSHSITAVYSGDGNYNAGTSAGLTETINAALPGAPSSLTATAASASRINLSWTASPTSGVTYNLYSSTTSGFTPSAGNRIATGVSGTTYAHTGLAASSTHYYVVTAQNAIGESGRSNQASATTPSGAGCHVVYTVTSQWNVGFGTAITIQNTGTTPINGWNLTWTWAGNQQITQSWNANYSQTGANAKLTNASWNPTIAAGATISGMGFNGSYSGSNVAPTVFYVNGTLCH